MPEVLKASQADFTFRVGELTTEDLKVTAFHGTEGINELFHFHVEFCSDLADLDFETIVGKPCFLEIAGTAGSRYVNGIVQRFARTGEGSKLTYYAADIVPVHWLLTKRIKSRVFTEANCPGMTIPDIIKKVLTDAGIPDDHCRWTSLSGGYEAREFVAQYRESEMDFISRLMEEEGIFYFFEHSSEGHKMVFGDASSAHVYVPNDHEYPFRDPTGLVPEKEFVFNLRDTRQVEIGAVTLDDYNFEKPDLQLRTVKKADKFTSLELTEYPGEFVEKSVGDRYAQTRLEEFQAARRVVEMSSIVRGLLPGYKFSLVEHPVQALNQDYLVTHLSHRATQPQSAQEEAPSDGIARHEVEIRAIPASVPYRPPRVTPRPTIVGSQTATVVGPSGEEIYCDQFGRVKVQFRWDQEGQFNENSSFWIRTSQGWAGGHYGMMFLPRIGQEVIVDFLEGNPDYPVITGRLNNADQMPPYTLPDEKTKSVIKTSSTKGGGGTNELRFEDLKGSEQILIYAEKDHHIRVKAARVATIGGADSLSVGGDRNESFSKSVSTKIGLDLKESITGNATRKVDGNSGLKVAGNLSETADGSVYIKSGTTLVIEGGSTLCLKVGGNFISIGSSGIDIQGSMVNINSGGSASNGTEVSMADPAEPAEADTVGSGSDKTYSQEAHEWEGLEVESISDENAEEEAPEEELSWVDIELVDDENNPCPYERYELTLPNGKKRRGWLDGRGQAHVTGIPPGQCEVTFPNLDREGWRR